VLRTDRQSGPALARNLGAEAARGEVLFFLDSDCLVHPRTVGQVAEAFAADASLDALIGSYDTAPEDTGFLSRYRNLMHCYYHQRGKREATTFWGACGAIRARTFFATGGFDTSFVRPSIEDIEFGARLKRRGAKIMLDPAIQIKHRKRWTWANMLRTDIRDRAIPWTRLILQNGKMPNDLNTGHSQRLSVLLTLSAIPLLVVSPWISLACWIVVAAINRDFYFFLARHWSPGAALLSIPLHLLYFAYSGVAFGLVTAAHYLRLGR
jgi:glycosyltransferase involved in cell wall biosynthesis